MAKAFISLVRCATRSDNGDTLPIVSRIIASADHETTAVSSQAPAGLNPPENSAGWALWCITPRLGPVYVSKDATATAALPRGPNDETEVWDTPRVCVDGRWAVVSTDGQGETDVAFPETAQTQGDLI